MTDAALRADAHRARASRGEVHVGTDSLDGVREMVALGATVVDCSSDAAVLRSSYASVVDQVRRALAAGREGTSRP